MMQFVAMFHAIGNFSANKVLDFNMIARVRSLVVMVISAITESNEL